MPSSQSMEKQPEKRILHMQAIAHGTAYVAEISMGANDVHALQDYP